MKTWIHERMAMTHHARKQFFHLLACGIIVNCCACANSQRPSEPDSPPPSPPPKTYAANATICDTVRDLLARAQGELIKGSEDFSVMRSNQEQVFIRMGTSDEIKKSPNRRQYGLFGKIVWGRVEMDCVQGRISNIVFHEGSPHFPPMGRCEFASLTSAANIAK